VNEQTPRFGVETIGALPTTKLSPRRPGCSMRRAAPGPRPIPTPASPVL